eukprot:11609626-Heterocapsa_arctica.AAC.1
MERQQQMASQEAFKYSIIKQIADNTGIAASYVRNEANHTSRQERIQSMFNAPGQEIEVYTFHVQDLSPYESSPEFGSPATSEYVDISR